MQPIRLDDPAVRQRMSTDKASTRALERGIRLLLALSDREAATVTELATATGLNRATVYRLLATLRTYDFVTVVDSGGGPSTMLRYRQGTTLGRLAEGALSRALVAELAQPQLELLQNLTGEAVSIYVRAGHHRVCILHLQSQHRLRFVHSVGELRPLTSGSSGIILLTEMPPTTVRLILKSNESDGWRSPYSINDLVRLVSKARSDGYVILTNATIPGVGAVAAPLLNPMGRIVAAVTISGPLSRFSASDLRAAISPLQETLTRISSILFESTGGDRAHDWDVRRNSKRLLGLQQARPAGRR